MNDRLRSAGTHRVRRWRWASLLLAPFVALLVGSLPGTTRAATSTSVYDAQPIARVDVQMIGVAEEGPASLTDVRVQSVLPSADGRGTSTTPVRSVVATEAASSANSGTNLGRQLASEQQMGEVGIPQSGANSQPFKPLRAADGLAENYGGNAADWSKMSSSSYTGPDGRMFETHWYENTVEGIKTESKAKFQDSSWLGFK